MPLKLALIQMNSGADMDANITALQHAIKSAADQGARLVVTPENIFLMDEPKAVRPLYTQGQHPGVLAAAQMAKQYGVWLLVGSVAVTDSDLRLQDSGKCYNRSILFSPEGNITATYDKIHLFDVEVGDGQSYRESAKMLHGERAVTARLDDEAAILGMTICYDLRFAYLYRALAKAGANILCVPSAFTQVTGEAHWHVLLRARAIEHGCFVIAPAQCGTHPGNRKTYGHSLVVDPWGRVIADGGTEPGIVLAEIDLGEVENIRRKLPCLKHDRTYTS